MPHLTVPARLAAARRAVGALLRRPSLRESAATDQACPSCRCTGQCPTVEDAAVGLFALTLSLSETPINAWDAATEDQREGYRARARFVLGFAGVSGG